MVQETLHTLGRQHIHKCRTAAVIDFCCCCRICCCCMYCLQNGILVQAVLYGLYFCVRWQCCTRCPCLQRPPCCQCAHEVATASRCAGKLLLLCCCKILDQP